MDWIVTTARSVDEAQTRALDLLGVDSADAEIQVIEEGKTGLFGRTKTEARVRARIKPKAPPAKEERRPSRGGGDRNRNRGGNKSGGGGNNRSGGNSRGNNNNRGGNSGGGRDGGNNRGGGGRSNADKSDNKSGGNSRGDKVATASAAAAGSNSGGRNEGNSGGGRDGGNNRGGGGGRNRGGNRGGGGRSDRGSRNNEDRVEMPVEEQRETLENFVTGVAKAFDSSAKVKLVEEGTTLQAQVTGGDLGRLVGNKASTLQSLEELARTAMHRAAAGRRYHRIQVDVDEYRARRREALVKFATGLAETVAETGESKAMEPMGAADRKLIHDAVGEVPGVETVSEGRDPRRYIVLLATDTTDEEE